LERVLYFEAYVIVEPGDDTGLSAGEVVTDERKRQLDQEFPLKFVAMMGAEGIKELLKKIDVESLSEEIREKMKTEQSQQKLKQPSSARVKVPHASAEWMIRTSPRNPPELPLNYGAARHLRSNISCRDNKQRLKKLINAAPVTSQRKRMLQEAVDALSTTAAVAGTARRQQPPLKSLSDNLKGKQGRFRRTCSASAPITRPPAIVVGPELKLNQCGLPKKMALGFKPLSIIAWNSAAIAPRSSRLKSWSSSRIRWFGTFSKRSSKTIPSC
jgi:DNA-directed RNA polymerase subunit beta'